ncbi:ATP synthase protein I [Leeuwenhoekiella aestuarii]|uniref:ATP synthase protein I n=1 Tax=Leeuwenhoekiella aestuarii TaxID=2249426 RepID=A0A4Q0NUG5_9FLAO|nr:AtpZ/AtpI family protein [Leeuwenhoekiella aestuarii]RXG11641.1 ATP synthase protein I [Leeuwenhoekiella aestuarii]RXG15148.1 ATP synthase protein I [Leeuwenhoekiella aestuarii]
MESEFHNESSSFSEAIAKKEKRKLNTQQKKNSVWSGLGMMGMVGWSVVVPAVIGSAVGLWLDKHHPQSFSWTLTLLLIGVIIGAIIAGYWVQKEDSEIHNDKNDDDE